MEIDEARRAYGRATTDLVSMARDHRDEQTRQHAAEVARLREWNRENLRAAQNLALYLARAVDAERRRARRNKKRPAAWVVPAAELLDDLEPPVDDVLAGEVPGG